MINPYVFGAMPQATTLLGTARASGRKRNKAAKTAKATRRKKNAVASGARRKKRIAAKGGKARLVKGSAAAKAWGRKMKALKKKK